MSDRSSAIVFSVWSVLCLVVGFAIGLWTAVLI